MVGLSSAAEPIPRTLPPAGIEISAEERASLASELQKLQTALAPHRDHALAPDVEVFLKAVDLALRHGEFYKPQDVSRARDLLQGEASSRVRQLAEGKGTETGKAPWTRQRGRLVRGYRSRVDGSVQPYGLVIPDDVDFNSEKPVPLYVWLHGRGDTQTDVHFIAERMRGDGQIKPPGAIVLHPFGRHCLGFKSTGEIDVLEAIEHVRQQYRIDPDRVVLMGFSMGGAGAWHVGAHYTDRFVAISPGAGFAETARYTNLSKERYPPDYEQLLWGVYDVPGYVRNLFNRTVIAYSGELDKQIQAARVMEEAYQEHGQKLNHVIGPGMGHRYHPDSLAQILQQIDQQVKAGRQKNPQHVSLQTRTLRYSSLDWVTILGLQQHWRDSRVDAAIDAASTPALKVTTANVTALRLTPWRWEPGKELQIDGQRVVVPANHPPGPLELVRDPSWRVSHPDEISKSLVKRPGLQGPIDDVFLEPFLVVTPTGRSSEPQVQDWIDFELAHFQDRWRALFRGELRTKRDVDVTSDDISKYHLIVWGTPESNVILRKALDVNVNGLPIRWSDGQVTFAVSNGGRTKTGEVQNRKWPASTLVPALIYPNPLPAGMGKYLVVNSGPTFREAHDRTNSLQNPKLPDWAIIDVTQAPSASSPGRIVAADFFGERWELKSGEQAAGSGQP
jgi:predicted esterase